MSSIQFFYVGTAAAGSNIGSYKCSADCTFSSYRLTLPVSHTQILEISVLKNGNLVDSLEINPDALFFDSGIIQFDLAHRLETGDILSLEIAAGATVQDDPIELTIQLEQSIGARSDLSLENLQIQTPLVANMRGFIAIGTWSIFRTTFSAATTLIRARYFLTGAVDTLGDCIVQYFKGATLLYSHSIAATSLDESENLAIFFEAGSVLEIKVVVSGSASPLPENLQLFLDYRHPEQTVFSKYQAPLAFTPAETFDDLTYVLKYIALRDQTLAIGQFFLETALGSALNLAIHIAGIPRAFVSIPAGDLESTPTAFSLFVQTGQEIAVRIQTNSPSVVTGLSGYLDYFLDISESFSASQYYSDPDDELILLARQVGIGGKAADALTRSNLEKYKRDVDNIINARLRPLYRVPLQKVARGNNPWPGAIQHIAQRLVLRNLLHDIYTEIEPNKSVAVESNAEIAQIDLDGLVKRETDLPGQRLRQRNFGSNPYTQPYADPAGAGGTTQPHIQLPIQ